jgi:DNA-directed RNA polymerase specialized sigma subunit
MEPRDFALLSEASELLARAAAAQRDRDERVSVLLRYETATVTEIGAVTGLSKARIYQIFEKKYGRTVTQMRADDRRSA